MATTNLQDISRICDPFPVPVGEFKRRPGNLLRDSTILTDGSDRTEKRIRRLNEEVNRLHMGASILVFILNLNTQLRLTWLNI